MTIIQLSPTEYSAPVSATAIFQAEYPAEPIVVAVGKTLYQEFTVTGGYNEYEIIAPVDIDYTIENLSPLVTEIDGTFTARLQPGYANVLLNFGNFKKALTLDMRDSAPSTWRVHSGYEVGSYGEFAWGAITSLLDEEKDAEYYNGSTYAECAAQPGGIARNPNCWGAAYDLSGVAVSYLSGGFWGGGALITERHYICSNHYNRRNKVGEILRFVGNTGIVRTRTILAQTTGHENNSIPTFPAHPEIPVGDLCVFLLSDDYTNDVAIYPIHGTWAIDSTLLTPATESSGAVYDVEYALPFITTNQNRKVLFCMSNSVYGSLNMGLDQTVTIAGIEVTQPGYIAFFKLGQQRSDFTQFQSNAIRGDSGSPVFCVLASNALALYSVMTYPNSGTLIYGDKANAMIAEVDARAVSQGVLVAPTGLTVTVASDPTL